MCDGESILEPVTRTQYLCELLPLDWDLHKYVSVSISPSLRLDRTGRIDSNWIFPFHRSVRVTE